MQIRSAITQNLILFNNLNSEHGSNNMLVS